MLSGNKNKHMKKLMILLVVALSVSVVNGQTTAQVVKEKLNAVNRKFDSAYFLRFTATYLFNSDTVNGKFESSKREASYIVKGSSYYSNFGDVEVLQNDSLSLTVMHDDKVMIMSGNPIGSLSSRLPLGTTRDSVIDSLVKYYTVDITTDEVEMQQTITFRTDSTWFTYDTFSITYEIGSMNPVKMEFRYRETEIDYDYELPENDSTSSLPQQVRRKKMTILFGPFIPANTDFGVFDAGKFVVYDPSRKKFIPKTDYKSYVLRVSNVPQHSTEEEFPEVDH